MANLNDLTEGAVDALEKSTQATREVLLLLGKVARTALSLLPLPKIPKDNNAESTTDFEKQPILQGIEHKTIKYNNDSSTAEMFVISSQNTEVIGDNYETLVRIGFDFINELNDDSFYNRYGSPKPLPNGDDGKNKGIDKIVKHFIESKIDHTVTLIFDAKGILIAAGTNFDITSNDSEGMTIAEQSLTIADSHHREGLGRVLVEELTRIASKDGFSHLYYSFNAGNNASRGLIESVHGKNGEGRTITRSGVTDWFVLINDDPTVSGDERKRIEAQLLASVV